MNYICHLNAFLFQHVKRDRRFTANHVSLYIALFQYWNYNRFHNPFYIKREDVMSITGIGSRSTYMKCMKELHQFGYIFYAPGKNKFEKSKIHIAGLDGMKENLLKQLELFESPNTGKNPGDENRSTGSNMVPVNPESTIPNMVPYVSQKCDLTGLTFETATGSNMGLLIKHKHINKREREKKRSLPPIKIFLKMNRKKMQLAPGPQKKNSPGRKSPRCFLFSKKIITLTSKPKNSSIITSQTAGFLAAYCFDDLGLENETPHYPHLFCDGRNSPLPLRLLSFFQNADAPYHQSKKHGNRKAVWAEGKEPAEGDV
jgi:hypothetical protein